MHYHQPYSETNPETVRPRLSVTHWAPHDRRRTGRTILSSMGCPGDIAEVVIGHMGVQPCFPTQQGLADSGCLMPSSGMNTPKCSSSISAGTAIRAAALPGSEPEMGYPELARILRRVGVAHDGTNLRDARELFRRMVFNILVDNTDDHEKNHSLVVVSPFDNGRLKLAPAYDVLPTISGQGYQEFICGSDGRDSTLDNAMSQCDAFGLLPAEAAAMAVIKVVNRWKEHFAEAGVTERDIESLAERIDGEELLSQRDTFDPTHFAGPAPSRKRPGPFRR
jgi:hypothetical protein